MSEKTKLTCCVCDWEATVGTSDPPVEASHAAIDHYLIFGHAIERVKMVDHEYNLSP
ncbi:MAG: hypothetical protein IH933_03755 [Euryarchaeota archaeon]|jgi:hypothetical protein|nr:hypothetical protein [Euryarchaeota archaeon]